jgi:hypothetical protein
MNDLYWMDEIHPTEIEFKINIEVQEGQVLRQYHPEQMVLIYFVGVRIFCSWLFINFVALLRTVLEMELQSYIPMAHINSVGVSVEFHSQFQECAVYADSWDLGKLHRVVLATWRKSKPTSKFIKGNIEFNHLEIKVSAWTGIMHTAVCEMEKAYRFYKIKKSQILDVELKIT